MYVLTTDDKDESKGTSSNLNDINVIDVIPSTYLMSDDDESVSASNKSPEVNQITCNDVVMIREKVNNKEEKKPVNNEYVYDIYYVKNSNIHLDLLYANNYEIKPFINENDLLICDDRADEKEDGEFIFI